MEKEQVKFTAQMLSAMALEKDAYKTSLHHSKTQKQQELCYNMAIYFSKRIHECLNKQTYHSLSEIQECLKSDKYHKHSKAKVYEALNLQIETYKTKKMQQALQAVAQMEVSLGY